MLHELQQRNVGRFFDMYDVDDDGFIGEADAQAVIQNLAATRNLAPDSAEYAAFRDGFLIYWNNIMEAADLNEDGLVSRDEWIKHHDELLNDAAKFRTSILASAGYMFDLMDADGDGQLSLADYGNWMRAFNLGEDALVDEVFAKLDVNGNGMLAMEEMGHLIFQFYYSDNPDDPGHWAVGVPE